MKRRQAKALLDKTILDFGDLLANLMFEAKLLIHSHKAVRSGETITFDKATGVHTHHSIGDWWNAISGEDLAAKRGDCHFYLGTRKGDRQSITDRFPFILNSQLRWLLVSGYEEYERFLCRLYAELGFCDRNLWRCADYGNENKIRNISSMTLADFRRRIRAPGGPQPGKIRNLLGGLFPKVQSSECKNSIVFGEEKISYRDYVDLIATMRHIIVHEQSAVEPEVFLQRLKKEWSRQDDLSKELKSFIVHSELNKGPHGWEIWLLDKSPIFLESCTNMDGSLRVLFERLGAHACLLYGEAVKHFGHEPFWKR